MLDIIHPGIPVLYVQGPHDGWPEGSLCYLRRYVYR